MAWRKIIDSISGKVALWRVEYESRKASSEINRALSYEVAAKYLPAEGTANILDIGCGKGGFPNYLKLSDRYDNIYLLDGNKKTIERLKGKYKNAAFWRAPEKLAFNDSSFDFIHTSHFIEHLYHDDLYTLFKEIDRVLKADGVLVISTPLLWSGFHNNLSHVKPYNKEVFIKYLCTEGSSQTSDFISQKYSQLELAYRYATVESDDELFWGSTLFVVELMTRLAKSVLYRLGFRRYKKTGYTLVLRKNGR